MEECSAISKLPNAPGVYALYAGKVVRRYVVYVGHTTNLKTRMFQHLVSRDSSINTASAAARLNPDQITEVRWWKSDEFVQDGRAQPLQLKAAELLAFGTLDPVLRSNDNPDRQAVTLSKDAAFKEKMEALFNSEAHGCFERRDNFDFVLDALEKLIERVDTLERKQAMGATSGA
jgi:hypothetical protein